MGRIWGPRIWPPVARSGVCRWPDLGYAGIGSPAGISGFGHLGMGDPGGRIWAYGVDLG